jgi:hypothetical protein
VGIIVEIIGLEGIHQGKQLFLRPNLLNAAANLLVFSGCLPHFLNASNVGHLLLFDLLSELLDLGCMWRVVPGEMQSSVRKTSLFFCWKVKISASSWASIIR